jgi:lipoate-protein ligase A
MKLRVIETQELDGFYNMALDEAIFRYSKKRKIATLRFYKFFPPTITVGKLQSFYTFRECSSYPIVKRPTGGRAILHIGDLTYSLSISQTHRLISGIPILGYKRVATLFQKALNKLGVEVEFSRNKNKEYKNRELCFQSTIKYELLLKGYKVFGSAQMREEGYILQQGTLMVNTNNKEWGEVGINKLTNKNIKYEEIINSVKDVIREEGIEIVEDKITKEEEEEAQKLLPKYQNEKMVHS